MSQQERQAPRPETRSLICPVCEEPLTGRPKNGRVTCFECGSSYDVEELEDQQARL